jgi:hypothetical protein
MFFLTCSTVLSAVDWVWALFAVQPIIRKIRRSTTQSLLVILKLDIARILHIPKRVAEIRYGRQSAAAIVHSTGRGERVEAVA